MVFEELVQRGWSDLVGHSGREVLYDGLVSSLSSIPRVINVYLNNIPKLCRLPRCASGKEPTCQCRNTRDVGSILGWEDPLEEGMATHSSILPW